MEAPLCGRCGPQNI